MRSHHLLAALAGLVLACDSGNSAPDAAGGAKPDASGVSIDKLCNHFVQISSESQDDQIAKRDRKQDYQDCMAKFPVMESQLPETERKNFRSCAVAAKDLPAFTACAPSLFAPPKAPGAAPSTAG